VGAAAKAETEISVAQSAASKRDGDIVTLDE